MSCRWRPRWICPASWSATGATAICGKATQLVDHLTAAGQAAIEDRLVVPDPLGTPCRDHKRGLPRRLGARRPREEPITEGDVVMFGLAVALVPGGNVTGTVRA